ncbi:hypothetical protein A3Q56_08373 [Intoshia linei]|uniref:Uncharacterized protein n=1 Tax=Intoshia linei TaxID=1819745 RepID=A0A177AQX9_9BILA|nr:hypothetical protein A3Q56_08373 [Intoshia linei]
MPDESLYLNDTRKYIFLTRYDSDIHIDHQISNKMYIREYHLSVTKPENSTLSEYVNMSSDESFQLNCN